MPKLSELHINNSFIEQLPADPKTSNEPRQVMHACFSYVDPEQPTNPSLIISSSSMLESLNITDADSKEFLEILTGAQILPNTKSYAMCYGGHQFGHWAGQLGDGRAINLAQVKVANQSWTLQLKGAGPTPYSRSADGLAVLRSSIREFLCSEAMFHLKVPSTRALSLALTGDKVLRDVLYDGNPAYEKGAIVCRVAPSFIRFGSFEILSARNDLKNLKALTDYTIQEYYPHLGEGSKETYLNFFKELAFKTADMIIAWQRVGFVQGVMNTDNMSALGLTIDYGPYGWLENYDEEWTPNTTDAQHRRYRFGNQGSIALWNLTQLANALYPLIEDVPALEKILDAYRTYYIQAYYLMLNHKLGLQKLLSADEAFQKELLALMTRTETDMTIFYRNLSLFDVDEPKLHIEKLKEATYCSSEVFKENQLAWESWFIAYAVRLKQESLSHEERQEKMKEVNPKYVLRNYMAQLAIEAADKGDYSLIYELYALLQKPYEEQKDKEKWFAKRPNWAKNKVGSSQLSCSS